jgi:crotonobetaine/carnitine-CoA ligase
MLHMDVLRAGGKRTMLDLFAEDVDREAAAPFVRYLGRTYSYAEVDEASREIAGMLSAIGVGAGNRVAIAMNNRPAFIPAFLAILRLGATAIPLNTLYKPDEYAYVLEHAECRAVVLEQALKQPIQHACSGLKTNVALFVSAEERSLAITSVGLSCSSLGGTVSGPQVSGDDIAGIFYTSGTTARPKGVMISHGNLMYSTEVTIRCLGLQRTDVPLLAFPLFHVNSLFYGVLTAIALGGAVGLLPKFSVSGYWEQAVEAGATWTPGITGPLIRLLLQQPSHDAETRHKLRFAVGGTFLSLEELGGFTKRFGIGLLPGWSMTETVSLGTLHPNYRPYPIPTTTAIGFPTIGQQIRIVRSDGASASPGEPGEILYRSPSIFAGYLNDPEATRDAFTEDGWLRTGDLAMADERGYLTFVDRKKDMIKSKGENVAAAEVERVLNEHPGVLESAVVGERDEQGIWGERVVAYVVKSHKTEVDCESLRQWTLQKLANFKAPQTIHFVETLPKTPLGKIQRALLKNRPAVTK